VRPHLPAFATHVTHSHRPSASVQDLPQTRSRRSGGTRRLNRKASTPHIFRTAKKRAQTLHDLSMMGEIFYCPTALGVRRNSTRRIDPAREDYRMHRAACYTKPRRQKQYQHSAQIAIQNAVNSQEACEDQKGKNGIKSRMEVLPPRRRQQAFCGYLHK